MLYRHIIKSKQGYKAVSVAVPTAASKVDVDVGYAALVEKYERRARKERQAAIDKAKRSVSTRAHAAATHFGAAKYVRGWPNDGAAPASCSRPPPRSSSTRHRLAADEACDG